MYIPESSDLFLVWLIVLEREGGGEGAGRLVPWKKKPFFFLLCLILRLEEDHLSSSSSSSSSRLLLSSFSSQIDYWVFFPRYCYRINFDLHIGFISFSPFVSPSWEKAKWGKKTKVWMYRFGNFRSYCIPLVFTQSTRDERGI